MYSGEVPGRAPQLETEMEVSLVGDLWGVGEGGFLQDADGEGRGS